MKSMEQYYSGTLKQKCAICGVIQKITDLWEPRWQWDMEGLLCKKCFDGKEIDFNQKKEFCGVCGERLSFLDIIQKTNGVLKDNYAENAGIIKRNPANEIIQK